MRRKYAKKIKKMELQEKPKIASLICVKNDIPKKTLLDSLKRQSDVYVLNDGNTEIECSNNINIIKYGAKSKAEAINKWVKDYGGQYDFVGIFDWDSEVENDFYERILPYFSSDEIAFVQSKIRSLKGFLHEEVETYFDTRIPEYFLSCGHNVVYRARILREIPLPDKGAGEDFLHSITLFNKGYKSVLAEDVISYEETPELKQFILREIKWVSLEPKYIKNIPKLLTAKMPILKKLEISTDLVRAITAIVIFLSMIFFRVNLLIQALAILTGLAVCKPKTLKSIQAFPLLTFTILGFLRGWIINSTEFIPTSKFKVNEKLIHLVFWFNIFVSIGMILIKRNILIFALYGGLTIYLYCNYLKK